MKKIIFKKNSLIKNVLFLILLFWQNQYTQDGNGIIQYVNPFIGTANGGNTFPGAVVPWGMASVSPHNSPGAPSGYIYGEKYFFGFGHTQFSGTGCADLGGVIITASKLKDGKEYRDYKTTYQNEVASPGYYSVFLNEPGIKAEVTATERCGITRLTSRNETEIKLLVDAGKSLAIIGGGSIKINFDNEIEGYNISGGFCGEENRQKVYFVAQFSRKFNNGKIWKEEELTEDNSLSVVDTSIGFISNVHLSDTNSILIKVGVSYVSIENARLNLEAEIPDWEFEKVKLNAEQKWKKVLSRIEVSNENESNMIKFYSALYHMLIHPNIIDDVNGDYPLMGRNGVGNYSDNHRYTVFSLWDTYRTLHPFLTLVYPEKQIEMINTMIDMYMESGFLPKWELAGLETYMMVGDAAVPVIADTYVKGLTQFDYEKAFEAMLKHTIFEEGEEAPPVRAGYHEMLQYGYIPFEQDWNDDWWVWGPVSTTLEYCVGDYSISKFAEILGYTKYAEEFMRRANFYKNLFDQNTLFMRPKLKNGNWIEPFDSLATEGSGDWIGSGGPGYVEGNAWNYTWFVPFDINGLVEQFGNKDIFISKLIRSFEENHFTINNEPDITYPYIFKYIEGEEFRTNYYVNNIMENEFGTDHLGLPGNDDCGTISGWYAFSALGIYPVTSGSSLYYLNEPIFNEIRINLNNQFYNGDVLQIKKKFISNNQSVIFNKKNVNPNFIDHKDLVGGGELIFNLKEEKR